MKTARKQAPTSERAGASLDVWTISDALRRAFYESGRSFYWLAKHTGGHPTQLKSWYAQHPLPNRESPYRLCIDLADRIARALGYEVILVPLASHNTDDPRRAKPENKEGDGDGDGK